jgi:hypothetical protein
MEISRACERLWQRVNNCGTREDYFSHSSCVICMRLKAYAQSECYLDISGSWKSTPAV